ncbi:alpha/beta hydrolase [Alcanivorax hongdengensis A-11-3]|uniref:Alpha/beta hydrolase n=1 Tax=Alcanivorax hongdengensis A-11-3 TaxID=1177179 RepID=L0WDG4_9GAMM|nr:alpha/beta fold hydrolase [Alcanivorax hongdengensis]EKF75046.1 alpha/beta hydrolase [Alcanivorax hongdengensis A-11-3]
MSDLLWNHADRPVAILLLAHGAGAPMDSDFMVAMAEALAARGISVARFEFPYMQRCRQESRRIPPDRAPKLLAAFAGQLAALADAGLPVWIGGKSMGGRMATMLAAQQPVAGVVALGYPFHPPGKPEKTRIEHLPQIGSPLLICQGDRDPFGKPEEVASYRLPASVQVHWLADGDHDFKPRKRSGTTQQQLIDAAASRVADLIRHC